MDEVNQIIHLLSKDPQEFSKHQQRLDDLEIHQFGLSISSLEILLELVLDPTNSLNQSSRKHIIKHYLFFTDLLPDSLIVDVISSLGYPKFRDARKRVSQSIQVDICEWLISVQPFVKNQSVFKVMYGTLLELFEFEFLRPVMLQLLKSVTNKKTITKSRAQKVMSVYKRFSNDRFASGLLEVYRELSPVSVPEAFTLYNDLERVQDSEYITILNNLLSQSEEFTELVPRIKRQRLPINEFTTEATISTSKSLLRSDTKSLNEVFFSPMSSNVLHFIVRSTDEDCQDLETWLALLLNERQLSDEEPDSVLLRNLTAYVTTSGHFPCAVMDHIVLRMIGNENQSNHIVWRLVSLINQTSFIDSALQKYLELQDSSMSWNINFLDSIQKAIAFVSTVSDTASISNLVKSVISKFTSRLQKFCYHKEYMYAILNFISTVTTLSIDLSLDALILPPALIYTLFLENDSLVISKLCEHINSCRESIKNKDAYPQVHPLISLHNSYVVDMINVIWRDKAFGLNKSAFHPDVVFGVHPDLVAELNIKIPLSNLSLNIMSIFSIIHSPAFSLLSAKAVKSLEEANSGCVSCIDGPLTHKSFADINSESNGQWLDLPYDDIKLHILESLDQFGLTGIKSFLFTHVKSLSTKTSEQTARDSSDPI
ncbi:hypothetical protein WICPIJ_007505 [Wickerhamomyces pijperi]|uniref:Uncharacterized protein n=1 Tax=Wickerhamomyces pijperi TaxID=599730 RepID=A0A9P8Q2F0_WICPI|nr:hypothetical protein WICPIJ_007505 [Wickerhamomyces pijperi]